MGNLKVKLRRRCVILNYIQLFPIFQHVFASTSHRIKTLQNIYKIAYYLKLSSERTFSILAICENALHKLWYLTAPNICATHSPRFSGKFSSASLISSLQNSDMGVSAKISASMSSPASGSFAGNPSICQQNDVKSCFSSFKLWPVFAFLIELGFGGPPL